MKKDILISIIMPIYNAEDYLHESIGSILSQDIDNCELILMNDGSTDNSLNIIKEYEKNNKNIKVISRENKGILKTRLDGVKNANGKYIVFLDADDTLPVDTLKRYKELIKEHDYDIIKGNIELVTDKGNIKKYAFDSICEIQKDDFPEKVYLRFLTSPHFNNVCSSLIKKELFNVDLDCKISMGEDQALMMSLFDKMKSILLITDVVYYYRMNNVSITKIKNVNKKCKNFDEIYCLYSKMIIPFFKKLNNEFLLKKAYSRYLRDLNMLYCEICQNSKDKTILEEYRKKLFYSDLTIEARSNLKLADIKAQKTYIFIKPILIDNIKKHKLYMKILKVIKK